MADGEDAIPKVTADDPLARSADLGRVLNWWISL